MRYDAVETNNQFDCDVCDLHDYCTELDDISFGTFTKICAVELRNRHFKKSDKSFEKMTITTKFNLDDVVVFQYQGKLMQSEITGIVTVTTCRVTEIRYAVKALQDTTFAEIALRVVK